MSQSVSVNSPTEEQNKVTTIILADDHPLVIKALKNEFEKESDLKVVAEATNGEDAVKLATELVPHIVIMDIGMPKLTGIEATRQIKSVYPDIIILVLTVYDDIEHILGILESGADGYLTKNILIEDIVKAVRIAIAGETVLSPNIFQQVLKYALRHNTKPLSFENGIKLTIRELEILKLVAIGYSNKKIADELNLGIRTVKSHLVDLFSKLKAFSRTEVVINALRAGFLKLDDLN